MCLMSKIHVNRWMDGYAAADVKKLFTQSLTGCSDIAHKRYTYQLLT